MKIQAINAALPVSACQPIKQVEFARGKSQKVDNSQAEQADSFTPSNLEQKYDLACRIAAYYKTQYEQLLKNGNCIA